MLNLTKAHPRDKENIKLKSVERKFQILLTASNGSGLVLGFRVNREYSSLIASNGSGLG
mgnify:FL=1